MRPQALVLVVAAVTGWVTAITMLGPLLVDLARELDVTVGQAGLLGAVTALPWALGAPAAGVLSDRVGRRPLIIIALVGVGAASLGSAVAPDFRTLVIARFCAGVFGSFGPASMLAAIGDLVPLDRRGSAMSWLNLGFGLAAVAGVPAAAVVAGLFGWRWAFALVGVLLLLIGLLTRLGFPAPPPTGAAGSLVATYRLVLRVPYLLNVLGANLLERGLFNATVLYFPAFLILSYGLDAATVAPALVLVALGTIAGTVIGGWLSDRLPRALIFVVAQVIAGAIALVLFGVAAGLAVSILVGGLFGLINSASRPAFLALSSELAPRSRGALLGMLSLTNQSGVVLGASVGALAIGLGGYSTLAVLVMLGGVGAAVLALPLTRPGRS